MNAITASGVLASAAEFLMGKIFTLATEGDLAALSPPVLSPQYEEALNKCAEIARRAGEEQEKFEALRKGIRETPVYMPAPAIAPCSIERFVLDQRSIRHAEDYHAFLDKKAQILRDIEWRKFPATCIDRAINGLKYVGSNLCNGDVALTATVSAVASFLTLKTERGANWVGPRNRTAIKGAIMMASALSVAAARSLVSGNSSINEVAIRAGWNALGILGIEAAITAIGRIRPSEAPVLPATTSVSNMGQHTVAHERGKGVIEFAVDLIKEMGKALIAAITFLPRLALKAIEMINSAFRAPADPVANGALNPGGCVT